MKFYTHKKIPRQIDILGYLVHSHQANFSSVFFDVFRTETDHALVFIKHYTSFPDGGKYGLSILSVTYRGADTLTAPNIPLLLLYRGSTPKVHAFSGSVLDLQ
ncbi:hypothetical protein FXV77_12660 [Sphingobacterium phlebotomi]|uniref:Uncharacterized protein n=1 Tax=Sphingobacterium phlebotomi TaxID=2605433 RepID=A0A5D4H4N5_9SPHI|nr:hypothetical protein [Sphingobacterium phlebotomi]TYR35567.1 hypothetical protein FXV77_12660 [Sphingobacterium phlebotomi]